MGLTSGNLQSRFPSKFKGPDGSHVALVAFQGDISLTDFHFAFLSPLRHANSITSVFSLSKPVTVLLNFCAFPLVQIILLNMALVSSIPYQLPTAHIYTP